MWLRNNRNARSAAGAVAAARRRSTGPRSRGRRPRIRAAPCGCRAPGAGRRQGRRSPSASASGSSTRATWLAASTKPASRRSTCRRTAPASNATTRCANSNSGRSTASSPSTSSTKASMSRRSTPCFFCGRRKARPCSSNSSAAGCAARTIELDRAACRQEREAVSRFATLMRELQSIGRPVTLLEFMRDAAIDLEDVYRSRTWSWTRLQHEAGLLPATAADEARLLIGVPRLLHIDDPERIAFLRDFISGHLLRDATPTLRRRRMLEGFLLTLTPDERDAEAVLRSIRRSAALQQELLQLLEVVEDRAGHQRLHPSRATRASRDAARPPVRWPSSGDCIGRCRWRSSRLRASPPDRRSATCTTRRSRSRPCR